MTDLWRLSATELGGLIRRGETSSSEIVQAHLDRIDEVNPSVNALTEVLRESAVETAGAIDRRVMREEDIGPLGGVPITIKENQDLAGSATTMGLMALKDAIAETTSPHLSELMDAGAIPIGRTNMPEFGMRWHTSNGLIGATKNPWDGSLTPGGSSGGEAAAIASGMSPLGIGNDGAGSLRWPAQCCGVYALKPSLGRVPVSGATPMPFAFQLFGVHGPMARKVADLRLCLQQMRARSGGDPWHIRAPFHGEKLERPIRVGVVLTPGGVHPHSGITAALKSAASHLEDAGYVTEEIDLPDLNRSSEIYTQIMSKFGRLTPEPQRMPVGVISEEYDRFWDAFFDPWEGASGEPTHDPMMERGQIAHSWSGAMERTPLILAPIATRPAWPVGSDLDAEFNRAWLLAVRTVVVVNLLGLPAVALPIPSQVESPQGVQILAPRFREDLCLEAAEAIEERTAPLTPIDPRM